MDRDRDKQPLTLPRIKIRKLSSFPLPPSLPPFPRFRKISRESPNLRRTCAGLVSYVTLKNAWNEPRTYVRASRKYRGPSLRCDLSPLCIIIAKVRTGKAVKSRMRSAPPPSLQKNIVGRGRPLFVYTCADFVHAKSVPAPPPPNLSSVGSLQKYRYI